MNKSRGTQIRPKNHSYYGPESDGLTCTKCRMWQWSLLCTALGDSPVALSTFSVLSLLLSLEIQICLELFLNKTLK